MAIDRQDSPYRRGTRYPQLPIPMVAEHCIAVDLDERTVTLGAGDPGATVRASRFEVLRAMGGRRSADQVLAYGWDGDPTPYVALMSSYASRAEPLVE